MTELNGGGMIGSWGVMMMRFLDRWHWWSVEGEVLAKFVVETTFRKRKDEKNRVEVFTNADINKWGKQEG